MKHAQEARFWAITAWVDQKFGWGSTGMDRPHFWEILRALAIFGFNTLTWPSKHMHVQAKRRYVSIEFNL